MSRTRWEDRGRDDRVIFRTNWIFLVPRLATCAPLLVLTIAFVALVRPHQWPLWLLPLAPLLAIAWIVVDWWQRVFVFHRGRLYASTSLLHLQQRVLNFSFQNWTLVQPFLGKLLDYGDVEIGMGANPDRLECIGRFEAFVEALDVLRQQQATEQQTPPSQWQQRAVVLITEARQRDFPSHVPQWLKLLLEPPPPVPRPVDVTLKPIAEEVVKPGLGPPLGVAKPMRIEARVVVPPDFELETPHVQTVEVSAGADSEPINFKIVSTSSERKMVAVDFFQESQYLGRVEVETALKKERRASQIISAHYTPALRVRQLSPDLTILIVEIPQGKERCLYRFLLLSPLHELALNFENAGEIELQTAPEVYFEEIFAELNDYLREGDVYEEVFFKRLNSLGTNFYDQLFPEKLKRIYMGETARQSRNRADRFR